MLSSIQAVLPMSKPLNTENIKTFKTSKTVSEKSSNSGLPLRVCIFTCYGY